MLFQCILRWWLGRTAGDLLTSCRASCTAGITPWPAAGASQSTHYLRLDSLTYAGLGVARRGGEEAGDVDVVLVVAVVVGVDLLAELAELPRPGLVSPRPATHQQQGDQPQPHGHQVALGSPMVTTRQH